MSKFKIGDLVMVKEGTHDEKMPDNRIGLIVEEVRKPTGPGGDPGVKFTAIYKLCMSNGITLNFHEMFLERAGEKNV